MTVSNLQILRTLIAKDWRLFRVPMVALIIVGAGCYLMATAAYFDSVHDYHGSESKGSMFAEILFNASIGANFLTCFMACALGGVAIAGERTERTSDFLGLLPLTRWQIILSKLVTSALMLGVFAAGHVTIGAACVFFSVLTQGHSAVWPLSHDGFRQVMEPTVMWLGSATCLFGVGWLFSTFMTSGPISACISIAVTAISIVLATYSMQEHHYPDWLEFLVLASVTFGIGFPSLMAGSLYYLRRIAP